MYIFTVIGEKNEGKETVINDASQNSYQLPSEVKIDTNYLTQRDQLVLTHGSTSQYIHKGQINIENSVLSIDTDVSSISSTHMLKAR